jgi:hypothetical protein
MTMRFATLVLVIATCGTTATGALIDDFNTDDGLSGFTFSKILDQGDGTTNISFNETGGTINVTSTGTSGAEQALLLTPTVLEQGMELQLDSITSAGGRDFGIAIGESHADLGNGTAGDNRNTADYVFLIFKNLDFDVTSRGFVGNSEIDLFDANDSPEHDNAVGVTQLFMKRMDNDDLELGYYQGAVRTPLRTITPATLDIYNNVGLYADLRVDGGSFAGADNLRVIPEPASALLGMLALVGLAGLRRRG